MKKIIYFIVILLTSTTTVTAQSFMRYNMKDGSFNGFYTDCIDSICHTVIDSRVVSKVYSNNVCHTIPVDDIVDISFESATAENGDLGEYRLYEFDFEDSFFKKAYIDNRTFCYASKTGEFGPNDIQLFASVYNDVRVLLFTDEQDRISRYFDGVNYIILDYKDDDTVDIIDYSEIGRSVKIANKSLSPTRAIHFTGTQKRKALEALCDYAKDTAKDKSMDRTIEWINTFSNIFTRLNDNPELHHARIFANTVVVAADIAGILASIGLMIETGGLTAPLLALQLKALYDDMDGLLQEIWPDVETMERYKQFYADKYGINVFTKPATDVKSTTATLNGIISSGDGLKGSLNFRYYSAWDNLLEEKTAVASYNEVVTNQYEAEAYLTGLAVDATYDYYLEYTCKVDGLQFTYSKGSEFTTLKPSVYTGEVKNKSNISAEIECEYEMLENAWCGIYYFTDYGDMFEIPAGGYGKQIVTLTDLEPSSTYSYRAVMKIDGRVYSGELKQFTTDAPDLSGTWKCTETHYKINGEPYYTSYFVTLYSDGRVGYSESANIFSSTWSVTSVYTKTIQIDITDLATQTVNSGKHWSGKIDNLKNPTTITGTTYRWNYNQNGAFNGDGYEFYMTK